MGELAGDEERPQDTSEALSTVVPSHTAEALHTAEAASMAAAIIVDGCAFSDGDNHLKLTIRVVIS